MRMKALLKKHILWYVEKIDGDRVDSYAAQVSFWMFIAFIPFLMFVLGLLRAIRFEETNLLFAFAELLPEPVEQLMHLLFDELTAPNALLPTTAVVCLWSASTGMLALVKGLYAVFDVSKWRNFVFMRVLAVVYTLAFAVILLVSFLLLIFGDLLYDWLLPYFPHALPWLIGEVKPLTGFVILLLFFWLIFGAIPRKQIKVRFAFWGAAFSAAGWVLFSFFFSIYVTNFASYATIYGSLAAIIILMIWLFICMYILLLGGEITVWLQNSGIRGDFAGLCRALRQKARKGVQNAKEHPNGR